ncbi:MAG TPA: bifunctional riboflavin kinase/FMN adenylyltransferase [Acholeplasmatales bacterium]|nr:bifunctional riboflavin kinase/FMN adenylyltransferase [Acholeplasmatales bacterium]
MEIIRFENNQTYALGALVVALGEFDGLHVAHQALIQKTIDLSKSIGAKSAVLTFDPHPDFILRRRSYLGYLTPLNVKIQILEELGVDYLIIVPFTLELSKQSPTEFENQILKQFEIVHLIVGFDFRYGFKGAGNAASLAKNYSITIIERINFENQKIGSNAVRDLLLEGRMEEATKMLGRYYNITGVVEKGNQVGRRIGFRTANITLSEEYQLLKKGVYGVYVTLNGKKYLGVCNIGNNPTLNYIKRPRLEVHILDFNSMIYDQVLSVDFVVYLREEIHFDTVEALITQIHQDIENTIQLLGEQT